MEFVDFNGRRFENISFSLNKGEVVSLTGLLGSGCFDFGRSIFGLDLVKNGSLILKGEKRHFFKNTMQSVKAGICFLSENRKTEGIYNDKSVLFNITISSLKKFLTWIFLKKSQQKKVSDSYIKDLSIKLRDVNDAIKNLSGGNQQKVIIARWLVSNSDIFIFCLPTQGIDVEGKREILNIINNLSKEGKAILIISDELDEIISVSNRILVFRDKKIIAEFVHPNFDKEKILNKMIGG